VLLVVAAIGCGGGSDSGSTPVSSEPVRDVLLITIDTLRADALGFAGNADSETPVMDRLAEQGRIFSWAHAHNVLTLPSHANLLTGLYPYQHGVRDNGGFVLGTEPPTLAGQLAEAGFATGAVVAAYSVAARYGLDRGFDLYDDDFGVPDADSVEMTERAGDEVVRLAGEWWTANADQRRFLWVHLFEPHAPYAPPEPQASRFGDRPYLGEVAATDAYLASLLTPFLDGRDGDTLIVLTADHGEALGEHGEDSHGVFAYQETLHVPLVLWGPPVRQGVDDRLARHVDIAPTILAATGVAAPEGLPGHSLLARATNGYPSYFEAVSSFFSMGWAPLRGVIVDRQKLIELPVPELYDLDKDPDERTNLFRQNAGAARTLAQQIPSETTWPPEAVALDSEERRNLEALGYVTDRAPATGEITADDDPKNLIHLRRAINRAVELHQAGNHSAAIARIRQVLAERSDMPLAHSYLATFLLSAHRYREALVAMEQARLRGLAQDDLLRQLGVTLVGTGQPSKALEILEPLAARDPDAVTLSALALAQGASGRLRQGIASVQQAIALAPQRAHSHETHSFLLVQQQRWSAAEAAAERAVELDPSLANAWNNLGVALYSQERGEEAVEAWRQSLALDPRQFNALFQIAVAAAEVGDVAEARALLRQFLAQAPAASFEEQRRLARRLLEQMEHATAN